VSAELLVVFFVGISLGFILSFFALVFFTFLYFYQTIVNEKKEITDGE